MLEYTKDSDGKICFRVNKDVYPLLVIYRASYVFIERYYIGIDVSGDGYVIYLSSKEKTDVDDSEIVGGFQNELLHQSLRYAIEKDTKQIRELIVTRALYSAFVPFNEEAKLKDETDESDESVYSLNEIAKAWKDERS